MNTSCVPSLPHSLHPHSPHSSLTIPSLCVQKHCIGTLPWFRSESDVSKHAWPPSDLHGNSGTERGNCEVEGAKGGTEIIDLHRLAYPPNWNFALDEDESGLGHDSWFAIPRQQRVAFVIRARAEGRGVRGEGRGSVCRAVEPNATLAGQSSASDEKINWSKTVDCAEVKQALCRLCSWWKRKLEPTVEREMRGLGKSTKARTNRPVC